MFRDPGLFLDDIRERPPGQPRRTAPAPMGSLGQGLDADCAVRSAKRHCGFSRGV